MWKKRSHNIFLAHRDDVDLAQWQHELFSLCQTRVRALLIPPLERRFWMLASHILFSKSTRPFIEE
jgi:hypothetical protein